MISLNTIGISYDSNSIPTIYKYNPKLLICGISYNSGIVPPKNYFRPKLIVHDIAYTNAEHSTLNYEIL